MEKKEKARGEGRSATSVAQLLAKELEACLVISR